MPTKKLTALRIAQSLSAAVYAFFFVSLIFTALQTGLSGWPLSDYMINYSAGFIRRGFVGELLSICENPTDCANTFHLSILIILGALVFFITILAKPTLWRTSAILCLLFASGGLLDILRTENNVNYWGRKEIIFYAVIITLTVLANFVKARPFFIFASLLSVLTIFTHELFFVFYVPIIAASIYLKSMSSAPSRNLPVIYLGLCTVAFGLTVTNSGNEQVAQAILNDVRVASPDTPSGAIMALGWTFEQSSNLSQRLIEHGQFEYWLLHFLFTALSIALTMSLWAKDKFKRITVIGLFFWLITATAISASSGWDWGRWISILTIGSILSLYLFDACYENEHATEENKQHELPAVSQAGKFVVLATLLFMQSLTDVEHCCTQDNRVVLSAPWTNYDWLVITDLWAPATNSASTLGGEAVSLALRASELLQRAQATSDSDRAAEILTIATRAMQLSLQKLSEAAANGLTGQEGERIATIVQRIFNDFRDAGIF
jgi:hypothetical protein